MYETLALFVLVYSSVAGAIERTWISGPIVFTCFGLLVGPMGFWPFRVSALWALSGQNELLFYLPGGRLTL